ncbi:MAG: hypothetical protein KJ063_02250 [Anaerolineae bacterium]|nr:hypothetical protein [Anaerolineae bacterium]
MAEVSSIFDVEEFAAYRAQFDQRRSRFARYWKYYKAEPTGIGEWQTEVGKYIGAAVRNAVLPLFTPLSRAVELDVSLIPGDWQLAAGSERYQGAVDQVLEWGKWDCEGDVFVRFVVALGEAGLRIVDDRMEKRAFPQPVRPDTYLVVPMSPWDDRPQMLLSVVKRDKDEWAEVIEADRVRTFKNGHPYGTPERPAEYENGLGMVPFVVCRLDAGDGQGESTFDNTLPSLDQVNRQATYMSTIISRHAEPQWAVFGAEDSDLRKDGQSVWFFPEGSNVQAILAAVDFEGLLAFIQEIKNEMKDSLPELALSKLVGVERVAAATIELQLAEAVFKIRRLRKPCDRALRDALIIAGRAAQQMGIGAVSRLADGLVRFDKDRPVISLDALTRLQIQGVARSNEISQLALERERQLLAAAAGDESGQ